MATWRQKQAKLLIDWANSLNIKYQQHCKQTTYRLKLTTMEFRQANLSQRSRDSDRSWADTIVLEALARLITSSMLAPQHQFRFSMIPGTQYQVSGQVAKLVEEQRATTYRLAHPWRILNNRLAFSSSQSSLKKRVIWGNQGSHTPRCLKFKPTWTIHQAGVLDCLSNQNNRKYKNLTKP